MNWWEENINADRRQIKCGAVGEIYFLHFGDHWHFCERVNAS